MNRLLQGDVGSGKTVVAVYAMLLAVAHGQQAVLMAPTEVLARQHARTLGRLLAGSRVRIGMLTGGVAGKEREQLAGQDHGRAKSTSSSARRRSSVARRAFARLGLVVIDEQHKFGVRQRALLETGRRRSALPGHDRHAHPAHADDDALRRSRRFDAHRPPAGPAKPFTRIWPPRPIGRNGGIFSAARFAKGGKDMSSCRWSKNRSRSATANLEATFEELTHDQLADFRLGLIHGRMSAEEKDAAMQAFAEGRTQVLVATTVVEVGVDVPNATLMTIEGAERFGLAQLHQLRGRISRGTHPGFCCVFDRREDRRSRSSA